MFTNDNNSSVSYLARLLNPIKIDNMPVSFCQEAEHVGIIRSTTGNMPNLLNRISAHKKSLGVILAAGLARNHRGNPCASLRVHQLYQTPVLFSGLASLVLNKSEIALLDAHYLFTLQNLQRLHPKTPRAVVLFLAGSLPGEAILHTKQLTLFSMICRLPGDPLHAHAHYVLSCSPRSARSWFHQIRDICLKYSLPHPLSLLQFPPTRTGFKELVKEHVLGFWENKLRAETFNLPSLAFFDSTRLSLCQPSLLWLAAGSNSFESVKSLIIGKMTSGRYRSDHHCRHWTPSNRNGYCLAPTCTGIVGDLVHMLTVCPLLQPIRTRLVRFWQEKTVATPVLYHIITQIIHSPPVSQVKFILDPCGSPPVLKVWGLLTWDHIWHLLYLARTFAYYIHRAKMISLGRLPGDHRTKTET